MTIGRIDNCRAGLSAVSLRGRAALLSGILLSLAMTACDIQTLPDAPANQRYGYVGSAIVVHWDDSAHAESYTIYYGDAGCQLSSDHPALCKELASDIWSTSYTLDSPSDDAHDYWVVACNELGCSEIDAVNPAQRLPRTPDSVHVAQDGSSLQVAWNPVQEATHYKVYHNDYRDGCSLPDGQPYCTELDGNVVGAYTHIAPVPSAPFGFEVVDRTSDALTIDWRELDNNHHYWVSACSDAGCSLIVDEFAASIEVPIQYYKIYRDPQAEPTQVIKYTPLDSSPAHSQYVDKGLQPSAIYYYRVATCNDNGCSNDDDLAAGIVVGNAAAGLTESNGPVDVPYAPTLQGEKIVISITRISPDDATVTWNTVEGATYYELWKGSVPSLLFELAEEISAPLESQSFVTPTNRGTFGAFSVTSWKVRACNKAGCSAFSNIVTLE